MKVCSRCNTQKPTSEFRKSSSSKDGLSYWCVDCLREYDKQRYWKDSDRRRKQKRDGYSRDPEKYRQRWKEYRDENADQVKETRNAYSRSEKGEQVRKAYCQRHRDRIREYQRNYAERNREKINAIGRKWWNARTDKQKQQCREARKLWEKSQTRINPKYRLTRNIKARISATLKKKVNGSSVWGMLGYSHVELIKRLRKTTPGGYTWADFMDGSLHIDHIIPISAFNYEKASDIDFKRCWALDNLQLLPSQENLRKNNRLDSPFQPSLVFGV